MNKKIIFFDIDGTIIGEESHVITESTRQAIMKARENGHICMINTGRTKALVGPSITDLIEFDGFIFGCGTMITYHNKEMMHNTLSKELSQRIIDAIHRYEIDAVLEGKENDFQDELDNIHDDFFKEFILQYGSKGYGRFSEAVGKFDKFFTYIKDVQKMKNFQAEFENELEFIDIKGGFYEVLPKGFSKATGIEYLARTLGISMEDTVAIGDSNNDLTMLKCVNTAIAMGNATQGVKDIADYVTTHVDEDGIWNALKWLGVIS